MQNTRLAEQIKQIQRNRWQRLSVLAIILVVAVITGSMLILILSKVVSQEQAVSSDHRRLSRAITPSTVREHAGQIVYQSGTYDQVYNLTWSPDGKRIAVLVRPISTQFPRISLPLVQIWDATNPHEALTYHIPDKNFYVLGAIAWSADGKRLVVAAHDIYIIDARTTKLLTVLPAPFETPSTSEGSALHGIPVGRSSEGQSSFHSFFPTSGSSWPVFVSAHWSPDNQWLATGYNNIIYIWNIKSGMVTETLTGFQQDIQQVAWSPNGKFLATSALHQNPILELKIWDVMTWKVVKQYTHIGTFSWSSDSKQLALIDPDATEQLGQDVRIVDVLNGQTVRKFSQIDAITAAYWSPDGSRIAGEYERLAGKGNVILWDAMNGRQLLRFAPMRLKELTWSPDSKHIVSVTDEPSPRVMIWVAH